MDQIWCRIISMQLISSQHTTVMILRVCFLKSDACRMCQLSVLERRREFDFWLLPVCVGRGPQRDPDAVSAAVHHDPRARLTDSVNVRAAPATQLSLCVTDWQCSSNRSTWRPPPVLPDLPTMHREGGAKLYLKSSCHKRCFIKG